MNKRQRDIQGALFGSPLGAFEAAFGIILIPYYLVKITYHAVVIRYLDTPIRTRPGGRHAR